MEEGEQSKRRQRWETVPPVQGLHAPGPEQGAMGGGGGRAEGRVSADGDVGLL